MPGAAAHGAQRRDGEEPARADRARCLAPGHARPGPQGGVRQPVPSRRGPGPARREAPACARGGAGGTGPDVRTRDRGGDRDPSTDLEGCRHPHRSAPGLARALRGRARSHPGIEDYDRRRDAGARPALARVPGRGRHRPPAHQRRASVGDRAGRPERRSGLEARRRRRDRRAGAPHRAPSHDPVRGGRRGGRRRVRQVAAPPPRAGPRVHDPDCHALERVPGVRPGARSTARPEPGRYRPGG